MASVFGFNLPHISLKIFLLVHFCLLIFSGFSLPLQYQASNYFALGMGFWMLSDKNNTTPSLFFSAFIVATAVGDIFLMICFHSVLSSVGINKFSTFMTVMNLFLKPATFVYGWAEHKRRGGESEVSGYTNFDSDVAPTYLPDHITPPVAGAEPM